MEDLHNRLDTLDVFLDQDLPEHKDVELLSALAYAVTTLSWTSLRLSGANINEHPVRKEIDRVKLYMKKVKDYQNSS